MGSRYPFVDPDGSGFVMLTLSRGLPQGGSRRIGPTPRAGRQVLELPCYRPPDRERPSARSARAARGRGHVPWATGACTGREGREADRSTGSGGPTRRSRPARRRFVPPPAVEHEGVDERAVEEVTIARSWGYGSATAGRCRPSRTTVTRPSSAGGHRPHVDSTVVSLRARIAAPGRRGSTVRRRLRRGGSSDAGRPRP